MMDTLSHTYYVNLVSGKVLPEPSEEETHFKVIGTEDEINNLRRAFSQSYSDDLKTYARAHVPYKEYHKDNENVEYDNTMVNIYREIYKLGDEEAKRHIAAMGILNEEDNETPRGH
jgi:hypothetical protein